MTVLNRAEMVTLLAKRELVVSPILDNEQIGGSAIDLRLGTIALVVRGRGLSHVDPSEQLGRSDDGEHTLELRRRQKLERYEIPFLKPLLLHPHTLTLVPTLEWIKLPSNVKGLVTTRSSWAREGLNIATATFINPGYSGIITLELANLGQIPITVYPGLRIAQIALFSVYGGEQGDAVQSQFHGSFEPVAGDITKRDEAFIPRGRGD